MWFRRRQGSPRRSSGGNAAARADEAGGRLVFEADARLGEELRTVARSRGQSPEALAADLLARGLEREAVRARAEAVLASLTPREQQVAWRTARGQTNRQIAEALVVSTETIKTHVAHILDKLGVRSKTDLRVLLLDLGVRWWEKET